MKILPFGRRSGGADNSAGTDWTNQELADFYRAHRLLVQNGAHIGMERGTSDAGDPWMVFYDVASQDVFLHVARFDRKCVLICEHLGWHFSAYTVPDLIGKLESAIRDQFALRSASDSKVVVHPAAKIILSISAVFLLFKLDNSGNAVAKELTLQAPADPTSRKIEPTLLARAHGMVSRLFEGADAPVAIAALAGVILAWDLMESRHEAPNQSQGHSTEVADTHNLHDQALEGASSAAIRTGKASDLPAAIYAIELAQVQNPVTAEDTEAHVDAINIEVSAATYIRSAEQLENQLLTEVATIVAAPVTTNFRTADLIQSAVATNAPQASFTASLSVQAISDVIDVALSDFSSGLAGGVFVVAAGQLSLVSDALNIPIVDSKNYGFTAHTTLEGDEFMSVLKHIVSGLGAFELEETAGNLAIEQASVAGLAPNELGLWSNVMADGSTITIVGQLALIDDVGVALGQLGQIIA